MPRVGVLCPRGRIHDEECKACALRPDHPCHLTPDMLDLMRRDDEPGGEAHSPSRLLGCVRQSVFEQENDWYMNIEDHWPLVRGNMVHALMERAEYPGAEYSIRERRLTTCLDTKYGKQQFTGKPDLVVIKELVHDLRGGVPEFFWSAKVVDYKSKAAVKHELTEAVLEHQIQVNLYAWLVERELRVMTPEQLSQAHPDVMKAGYPVRVDELEIVYVDMTKTRRFNSEAELTAKGKRLSTRPLTYETLTLPPIKKKDTEWCESYIKWHIEKRIEAFDDLPPVLGKDDEWKCARCPVYDICTSVARARGEREPAA